MDESLPRLSATSPSQYVRLENCERFLRFRLRPDEERAMLESWGLTIQPLTPLLKEAGAEFEREVAEQVAGRGEEAVPLGGEDVEATVEHLRSARRPTILLQPSLEAPLGRYWCTGRADVVRLERDRKNRLNVLVADVKASRHERMEHRLQVATYARMIEWLVGDNSVPLGDIEGSVLRIQVDGSVPAVDPDEPSFDLDTYRTILERLATDPDSVVNCILELPFEEVPYHLGYKCDGCLYNAICMYDTAERLDLSLVPYMSAVEKRVLRGAGIETVPDLAALMTLPERGSGERELKVAPGQEEKVEELANQWCQFSPVIGRAVFG
ncbi:MAG: PD-(D/E)XK nuclease family protein [Chloroflexota bacterium]|nr:PD-(D/E)XK nuclease family protein [Chloroflexota bacterium]